MVKQWQIPQPPNKWLCKVRDKVNWAFTHQYGAFIKYYTGTNKGKNFLFSVQAKRLLNILKFN